MLINAFNFPDPNLADDEGLVAIGGELQPERILTAYSNGIFPWFSEGEPPLWWSPNPRFVLFPQKLKVSKSMKSVLKNGFHFKHNVDFESVIRACMSVPRPGQDGTWISEELIAAYMVLHQQGFAQCAEAYKNGVLVGGLFGIRIGNIFCGDSMFSTIGNASKFAFINFVRLLEEDNVTLIDCQIHTPHLESLGAETIPRTEFLKIVRSQSIR